MDTRRIQNLARRESPGTVTFLKGVSQTEVLALMSSSIVTVICSRENPRRVPIEAMALGSPVLSADIPRTRDEVVPRPVEIEVAVLRPVIDTGLSRKEARRGQGTTHPARAETRAATSRTA